MSSEEQINQLPRKYKSWSLDNAHEIPLRTIYRHNKRKREDVTNEHCSKHQCQDNDINNSNDVENVSSINEDNVESLSDMSSDIRDTDDDLNDSYEIESNNRISTHSDNESNDFNNSVDDVFQLDNDDNDHSENEDGFILQRLYEESSLTVDESILILLDLYTQNRWTKSSLSGVLLMLHKMLPNSNRLPGTVYRLLNYVENLVPPVDVIKHFYCQKCLCYLGTDRKMEKCIPCGADKKHIFHFFERDICQLIKYMFEEHKLAAKLKTTNNKNNDNENIITDITDGSEYKRVNSRTDRGSYDLTLILNTDGLQLTKSSQTNCWPLMFIIAELPEHLRDTFVIPIGLRCDAKCKPSMNTFLKPFCEKLQKCFNDGVEWIDPMSGNKILSKITAPLIIADAPARALLQNIQNFNGKHGCNVCEVSMKQCKRIAGERSKRVYLFNEEKDKLRHGRRMKRQALKVVAANDKLHIKGVKGDSIISILPQTDLGTCLIPEYMHSGLLGVGRQFVKIFFTKKGAWNLKYFSKEINNFLLQIRPPHFVNRMPRRITDFALFKASEYYYFILFYSLPALGNYLPKKYLDHWILFVKSLFILLQTKITENDLTLTERLLKLFVQKTEILYGDREMSYNLHQLLHYTLIVRRWGPLRVTSAFAFENFNGILAHNTHGTKHQGQEIMNNLNITQGIQILRNRVAVNNEFCSSGEKTTDFIGKNVNILFDENESKLLKSFDLELESLKVYYRAKINKETYTSEKYKITKTNSFTVQLNFTDNLITYGAIQFFFELESLMCFVLKRFTVEQDKLFCNTEYKATIDHIIPVSETGELIIVTLNQIKSMCHLLRVGNYVCKRPNLIKQNF